MNCRHSGAHEEVEEGHTYHLLHWAEGLAPLLNEKENKLTTRFLAAMQHHVKGQRRIL